MCNSSFHTAKSHLGWNVVGFMEADPDLVKEVHGLDIEDLRGHEKRMMQHNRCRPFSCYGKRDVAKRDYPKQRDGYNTGAYNAYKKPRQAGGDRKSYTCDKCNEVGHHSFECTRKGAGKAKKG